MRARPQNPGAPTRADDSSEGFDALRPLGSVRSEASAFSVSEATVAPAMFGSRAEPPASTGLPAPMNAEAAHDFERIYTAYFQPVSRWVRALGGLDADVDDLTQEVFLVVQRRLSSFDGPSVSAWLYGIARKIVSDHRRRAWVRRWLRGVDPEAVAPAAPGVDPAESLDRKQAQRVVAGVLNRMSAVRRSCFVLFEIEGYSGEEIAELEGIPVNTVYTRLHHARKDFFRLLEARMKVGGKG